MEERIYTDADKAELDRVFEIRIIDYIIFGIYAVTFIIVAAGVVFVVTMVFFAVIYGTYTYFYYLFLWLL